MKKKLAIAGVLMIALSLYFTKDISQLFASENNTTFSHAVKQEGNISDKKASQVKIVKQWDLPEALREVSGIAFISEGRFACVQDEDGYIFIYNTTEGKIEQKIPFAGAGDYEGITLAGTDAYIVRSDGMLFEVSNYASGNPGVKTYKTPFTADHNIEGLTFDKKGNRLLLSVKDEDPVSQDSKGIYAFDMGSKQLRDQPAFSLVTKDTRYESSRKKGIRPSDIGIHPASGRHYVIDGPGSKLLTLDPNGDFLNVSDLGASFAKPEGITFDPAGRIFISNERGKKTVANIMEIVTE